MALRVPAVEVQHEALAVRLRRVVLRILHVGRAEDLLAPPPLPQLVGVVDRVARLVAQDLQAPLGRAPFDLEHLRALELLEPGMREVERDRDARARRRARTIPPTARSAAGRSARARRARAAVPRSAIRATLPSMVTPSWRCAGRAASRPARRPLLRRDVAAGLRERAGGRGHQSSVGSPVSSQLELRPDRPVVYRSGTAVRLWYIRLRPAGDSAVSAARPLSRRLMRRQEALVRIALVDSKERV